MEEGLDGEGGRVVGQQDLLNLKEKNIKFLTEVGGGTGHDKLI